MVALDLGSAHLSSAHFSRCGIIVVVVIVMVHETCNNNGMGVAETINPVINQFIDQPSLQCLVT